MKQDIYNFVKERGYVSFVELSNNIEGFNGDLAICLGENIIIWSGMSQEACDALRQLTHVDKTIEYIPASPLVYLCDGGGLDLPLAKSARKYKKPHWLRVTLNVVAA